MKAIRVRLVHVDCKEAIVKLLHNYLKTHGFTISNPDHINGRHLDIFKRDKQRVAGFSIFTGREIDYNLLWEEDFDEVLNWIEEHGSVN